jgi:adenine-specific DNA-methyltransferase
LTFAYGGHGGKISILQPLIGKSGWLTVSLFTVDALDQGEDHLIFAASSDDGQTLDDDQASRLLTLPASTAELSALALDAPTLAAQQEQTRALLLKQISDRNAKFFEAELAKLDGWADDQVASSEKALKDIKKRIRELRNEATKAADLSEQARIQTDMAEAERRQRKLRQEIFEVEERIYAQRDLLVAAIRGKLEQKTQTLDLFTVRWKLA